MSAGDFNGDGFSDVIVGMDHYRIGALAVGRVELYLGSALGLSTLPVLAAQGDQDESYFGSPIASAGDVDGDGYADLLVGADQYSHGERDEGRVFLYSGSAVNRPPDCTLAAANPRVIWRPNGGLVPVSVSGVTDPEGDPIAITIARITQDEPRSGPGDGATCPDGQGVGGSVARLRAERSSGGDGRVYRMTFLAEDTHGAQCARTVRICVPQDRAHGHACQESDLVIDSTGPCDSQQAISGFRVDSVSDDHDARAGDGSCATAAHACTLRAAVEEANALVGTDLVSFDLPAGSEIRLWGGALEIKDTTGALTIQGPGDGSLEVKGQNDRLLTIQTGVTASISGLTLRDGLRSYRTADPGEGGACILNLGTLALSDALVTANMSAEETDAGGILNLGTLTAIDTRITDNIATFDSGGIENHGTATLLHCIVSGNRGAPGKGYAGGIFNSGSMTILDSEVSGNSSDDGGGIVNFGTLSLTRSTVSGNSANYSGAIDNIRGVVTVRDCTISANSAHDDGIMASYQGTMTFVGSTVSGNVSSLGGIMGSGGGTLSFINSTVSGNTGEYGAIGSGGALILLNSTVTDNTSTEFGGALTVSGGPLTVRNSVVAGNHTHYRNDPDEPTYSDCAIFPETIVTSLGYNVFGQDTGCTPGPTDITVAAGAVASILGPLQDNGGPTQTQALFDVSGNPATDGGDPAGCTDAQGAVLTTDQRGERRPSPEGGRCDIGSYELQRVGNTPPSRFPTRRPAPEQKSGN